MHIQQIELQNFATFAEATVVLPPRGIVLVTGENGAGKSTACAESIASACWGRTLRGTPGWQAGTDVLGAVTLTTDKLTITRERSGKKPALLKFNMPGSRAVRYDTPSKAQEDLNALIGTFDVWRRTAVFSDADAMHFSLATDRERKLLIENLRGLDCFDDALKRCREDLKQTEMRRKTLESKCAVLEEQSAGLAQRLQDLDEVETSEREVVAEPVPEEKQKRMRKLQAALTEQITAQTQELRQLTRTVADADARVAAAERAARLAAKDTCPTCEQVIPKRLRTTLTKAVEDAKAEAADARERCAAKETAVEEALTALQEEHDGVSAFLARAANIARQHEELAANRQKRMDKKVLLEHEQREIGRKLSEARDARTLTAYDRDELEVCEQVLGLKGVRAHLLGSALRAITKLTNLWLQELFPGVSIVLHERDDKVALDVNGLAHDHGYQGASSGERRRIDIAVLFALSDLEAAGRGVKPGTLLLDEIDNHLDRAGLAAFSDVLAKLARDRCVVLISHNTQQYDGLKPVKRLVVRPGTIVESAA